MGRSLVLALALACVVAGCNGSDDGGQITPSAGASPQQRSDGRLVRNPPLLNAEDINRTKRGSPERAFMLMWFQAQWGNAPSIPNLYDPRVRRAISSATIVGAYATNRAYIVQSFPKITGTRRTKQGVLLTVELLTKTDTPRGESFLLRRSGGSWRIVHDSFLETTIGQFAQSAVQERIDPTAKNPSRRAAIQGARAVRLYRNFLLQPRRARRPPVVQQQQQRRTPAPVQPPAQRSGGTGTTTTPP